MTLVAVVLGWLAGLALAASLHQPIAVWLALAGGALGLAIALRAHPRWRLLFVCLVALALGAARYQIAQPVFDATTLAYYNDAGTVTIEGVVWDEPEVRDSGAATARTNLRVRAESVTLPGESAPRSVSGLVLVYAPRYSKERLASTNSAEWRYGDRVRVTGTLETPPEFEGFSYRDYLARFGLYSQVRRAQVVFVVAGQGQPFFQLVFDFKARALATLTQIFPEPHAALLQGILLGTESNIPPDIKDAFSATGTSHVVAISGFNVSILVAVFMALFTRAVGPNRGALLTIAVIVAYTLLVGASASVVRAAIMGSLGLIALRLGRRSVGLNTLAAAAWLMTAFNPLTLWDVGFQLSAAATLGLILYAEPFQLGLQGWLERRLPPATAERLSRLVADFFLMTLAAQITTLPLIAYTFGQLSLISLIANVIILPVQPAVMVLGLIALVLGLVWLPLGQLAAWLTYPFTAYTLAFVQFFARVPGASIRFDDVSPALVVAFYAVLFGVTWIMRRPADDRPGWWSRFIADGAPLSGVAALGLVTFFAWGAVFAQPEPGRLRLTVLEAGPGDATLITTPSGAHVLANGGPSGGALVRSLAQQLPPFANEIEWLLITSARDSGLGGLPDLLARYRVSAVWATPAESRSTVYRTVMDMLEAQAVPVTRMETGAVMDLGDGAQLRVLPEGALRVEWGRFSALFLMDAENPAREWLPATVLLAGEDVADESPATTLDPRLIVLMGAADDPAPFAGRTVLSPAQRGVITVSTDGQHLWVETER
jgi:competence protein ComEC